MPAVPDFDFRRIVNNRGYIAVFKGQMGKAAQAIQFCHCPCIFLHRTDILTHPDHQLGKQLLLQFLPLQWAAVAYAVLGFARLAYFTFDRNPVPGFFKGMPTPAAALLVTSPLIMVERAAEATSQMLTCWGVFSFFLLLVAAVPPAARADDGQTRTVHVAIHDVHDLSEWCPWLVEELRSYRKLRVIVALGRFGYDALRKAWPQLGRGDWRPHAFAHAAESSAWDVAILTSYHPSRQNTQTGRLTREMFAAPFARARVLVDGPSA